MTMPQQRLEITGRVLRAEPGVIEVSIDCTAACTACVAQTGCKAQPIQGQRRVCLPSAQPWQSGDELVLSLEAKALVRGALILYLFPLLALLSSAGLAAWLAASEGTVIGCALLGLVLAGFALRFWAPYLGPEFQVQSVVPVPPRPAVS